MSPTSISDLSYQTLFLISCYSTLEKKTTLDMSLPYGKVVFILFLTDIQGREGWNKTYSRTCFIFCKGKNYIYREKLEVVSKSILLTLFLPSDLHLEWCTSHRSAVMLVKGCGSSQGECGDRSTLSGEEDTLVCIQAETVKKQIITRLLISSP